MCLTNTNAFMYHICNKLYSVRGHLVVLCLGFCKEYNSECWGACVFLNGGILYISPYEGMSDSRLSFSEDLFLACGGCTF